MAGVIPPTNIGHHRMLQPPVDMYISSICREQWTNQRSTEATKDTAGDKGGGEVAGGVVSGGRDCYGRGVGGAKVADGVGRGRRERCQEPPISARPATLVWARPQGGLHVSRGC